MPGQITGRLPRARHSWVETCMTCTEPGVGSTVAKDLKCLIAKREALAPLRWSS